jgi:hypothetical protein
MVQIDGIQRSVYIKLHKEQRLTWLIQTTMGQVEFRHANGEISAVKIEMAGPGLKRIRIAHLPPEVSEQEIRVTLSKYGAVKEIQNEVWSRRYRYQVPTGVHIVSMALKTHVPSKTIIAGHRVMVTYEGQPLTCFKCNESGHYHQECPRRRNVAEARLTTGVTSWAEIVSREERDAPQTSVTMDVPEQRTVQHYEIEGVVGYDNTANRELEDDKGQEEEEQTMDREQGGPAKKKVHIEQQGHTESIPPKHKRGNTERMEGQTSNNNGSQHNRTKTTKVQAPEASTDTEERDSGDNSEDEGTWFSLSTIERIGDEVERVQPTKLKRTKMPTTKKRKDSARDRSRSRVRNALTST